jgi:lipopolysaccharide export system permease protein
VPVARYTPLPVLSRYLIRQFSGILATTLAAFVLVYLLVDFFDRLDIFLKHRAGASATLRYFVFKIPLILTQMAPAAVIMSVLLSLGLLARRHEITALRASGVSLGQTAAPLLAAALAISVAVLAWNETVVPYASRRLEYINQVEIRKRTPRGILSDREIWYHGTDGFYHIAYVDKDRATIYGLIIYRLGDDFQLRSVIEVPLARWDGERWVIRDAIEHHLDDHSEARSAAARTDLTIGETLGDFLEVQREPEELTYALLRDWINSLTRKGIDASHYLVDLHLKLALPLASFVLALVGVPIGGRVRRHPSIAAIVAAGLAVGLAYWVLLALANSLGRTGALPPVLAAWSANAIFTLIGVALALGRE